MVFRGGTLGVRVRGTALTHGVRELSEPSAVWGHRERL